MPEVSMEYLKSLVRELSKLPSETEWVEFKCNNKNPELIAKYISGMSNAATLCGRPKAYLVWGINDDEHAIVGTTFNYRQMKKGNEELEAWLNRMINPKIDFGFYQIAFEKDRNIVLLEIPCAETEPTKFMSEAYIRIGSNVKPLLGYKEKEMALWRLFDKTPYELRIAAENIPEEEIANILDYAGYYDKMEAPLPRNFDKVLDDLKNEKFIVKNDAANWDITNLGVLTIGKNLKQFEKLGRKTIRIIWYKKNDRLEGVRVYLKSQISTKKQEKFIISW